MFSDEEIDLHAAYVEQYSCGDALDLDDRGKLSLAAKNDALRLILEKKGYEALKITSVSLLYGYKAQFRLEYPGWGYERPFEIYDTPYDLKERIEQIMTYNLYGEKKPVFISDNDRLYFLEGTMDDLDTGHLFASWLVAIYDSMKQKEYSMTDFILYASVGYHLCFNAQSRQWAEDEFRRVSPIIDRLQSPGRGNIN